MHTFKTLENFSNHGSQKLVHHTTLIFIQLMPKNPNEIWSAFLKKKSDDKLCNFVPPSETSTPPEENNNFATEATKGHSHRLFDLLILASQLLGLVDPLTLIFWKSLQIQLKMDKETRLMWCCLKKNFPPRSHKPAEKSHSQTPPKKLYTLPKQHLFCSRDIAKAISMKFNRGAWYLAVTFQHTLRKRLLLSRPLIPACRIRAR